MIHDVIITMKYTTTVWSAFQFPENCFIIYRFKIEMG